MVGYSHVLESFTMYVDITGIDVAYRSNGAGLPTASTLLGRPHGVEGVDWVLKVLKVLTGVENRI
jgi:hypothetical protein